MLGVKRFDGFRDQFVIGDCLALSKPKPKVRSFITGRCCRAVVGGLSLELARESAYATMPLLMHTSSPAGKFGP